MTDKKPLQAHDIEPQKVTSNYPKPFAKKVEGRIKRRLGDYFGLSNFGVNLTVIEPNSSSALHHSHAKQDELIYILEGHPTLYLGEEKFDLVPGMVAGFPADGVAHNLENHTDENVVYIEIGDRTPGDKVTYPNDDLIAELEDGAWVFKHKDGTLYD